MITNYLKKIPIKLTNHYYNMDIMPDPNSRNTGQSGSIY